MQWIRAAVIVVFFLVMLFDSSFTELSSAGGAFSHVFVHEKIYFV